MAERGESSNSAPLAVERRGEDVVKLSTMEGLGRVPDGWRDEVVEDRSPGSGWGAKGRLSFGESGEKDGKDVRDLSEAATDDAELEGCEVIFLALLGRTVWDL